MSDVPTHKLELPISKVTVVLKDWITGLDDERIQAHYYNGGKVDPLTKDVTYSAEAMNGADHEAFQAAVVSVDGQSDNVLEAILNLPLPDFKLVNREVKKVVNPLVESEPTDSDRTTPAS